MSFTAEIQCGYPVASIREIGAALRSRGLGLERAGSLNQRRINAFVANGLHGRPAATLWCAGPQPAGALLTFDFIL